MKTTLLCSLFFVLCSLAMGLSSYTDTGVFTLDTVAPSLDLISPNGGEEWYLGHNYNIVWTASNTNLNPNSVSIVPMSASCITSTCVCLVQINQADIWNHFANCKINLAIHNLNFI